MPEDVPSKCGIIYYIPGTLWKCSNVAMLERCPLLLLISLFSHNRVYPRLHSPHFLEYFDWRVSGWDNSLISIYFPGRSRHWFDILFRFCHAAQSPSCPPTSHKIIFITTIDIAIIIIITIDNEYCNHHHQNYHPIPVWWIRRWSCNPEKGK